MTDKGLLTVILIILLGIFAVLLIDVHNQSLEEFEISKAPVKTGFLTEAHSNYLLKGKS